MIIALIGYIARRLPEYLYQDMFFKIFRNIVISHDFAR